MSSSPGTAAFPTLSARGVFSRRCGPRSVLHDPLECPPTPLIEIEATRERLEAHPLVLCVDREARDTHDQIIQQLVVERFQLLSFGKPFGVVRVYLPRLTAKNFLNTGFRIRRLIVLKRLSAPGDDA